MGSPYFVALKGLLCWVIVAALLLDIVSSVDFHRDPRDWDRNTRARQRLHHVSRNKATARSPLPRLRPANESQATCQAFAPEVKAAKENVWAPLTGPETSALLSWLFQQRELNLTRALDNPWFSNLTNFTMRGNGTRQKSDSTRM